jgi:hypothetical protein
VNKREEKALNELGALTMHIYTQLKTSIIEKERLSASRGGQKRKRKKNQHLSEYERPKGEKCLF